MCSVDVHSPLVKICRQAAAHTPFRWHPEITLHCQIVNAAYFSLDPNRVLDIMLDCYEGWLKAGPKAEHCCLLDVLGMFSRTSLVQVLTSPALLAPHKQQMFCTHT
jgi:hypothetical protein